MDDFLHHLIVVAAFFAAALAVKIGVAFLALTGSSAAASHTLPVAVQLLSGLAAAYAAHHRTRHPRLADGAVSRS